MSNHHDDFCYIECVALYIHLHRAFLSLSYAPQVSENVQVDAGFVCGKAVVFCAEIKERPCIRYQRLKSKHVIKCRNYVTGWMFNELGFNFRQGMYNFFF